MPATEGQAPGGAEKDMTWSGVTARTVVTLSGLPEHSWLVPWGAELARLSLYFPEGANALLLLSGPLEPSRRQEMVLPSSRLGLGTRTCSSPPSSDSRKCCIGTTTPLDSGIGSGRLSKGTDRPDIARSKQPRRQPHPRQPHHLSQPPQLWAGDHRQPRPTTTTPTPPPSSSLQPFLNLFTSFLSSFFAQETQAIRGSVPHPSQIQFAL